jgi:hypothetical protein
MIAHSFFLSFFATGAVPSDVEQDDHPQKEADVERGFVEDLGDLLLVVPNEVTEEGEDGYPHPRTESGKETEPAVPRRMTAGAIRDYCTAFTTNSQRAHTVFIV